MKQNLKCLMLLATSGMAFHVACDKAETVRSRSDAQHAEARGATREQNQEQVVPKTDIAVLERFINLPYAPTQVKWNTSNQPGGNDWSLRALLFLKPDDMQHLMERAERISGGSASVPRDDLKDWFPSDFKTEYKAALESTSAHIPVTATRISGALFAAADKSPAIHGDALVFEKYGLVYLVLFTM